MNTVDSPTLARPDAAPTRSIQELSHLAIRGAASLFVRSALVQTLTFGSTILVSRFLTPEKFGTFAILIFLTTFFTAFSDVGLGAALIQQSDDPTREDLSSTFTVQLLLALVLVGSGFLIAPFMSSLYGLDSDGVWLIRSVFATVSLGLLRTIPSLLLERQLAYARLGLIEVGESLGFHGTIIALVLLGYGVWSFVWALCIRGLLGLVIAYVVAPWRPVLGASWPTVRRLLRFGIPYQLQAIITLVKDSMTPTALALIIGTTAVGYVSWAYTLASIPLLITSVLARVAFPTFSRAQGDIATLKSLAERSIQLSAIVFLPLSCLLIAAGPQIVQYVYTEQWLPALPSFYLFSIAFWTGPLLGATFFSLFYATNRSHVALTFVVFYAILDWGIGLPLIVWLGFNGIAIRTLIVAYGTLPVLLWVVRSIVPIRILGLVARPALVAASVGGGEYFLLSLLPGSLLTLIGSIILSVIVYVAIIAVAERKTLATTFQDLLPASLCRSRLIMRYFSIV